MFERMCRLWAEDMAEDGTFGGIAARVLSGAVHDRLGRIGHEVDVAVFDPEGKLLAIGEAKWGDVVGMGHLDRMKKVADLLAARDQHPGVIALFSGTGFTAELRTVAAPSDGSASSPTVRPFMNWRRTPDTPNA